MKKTVRKIDINLLDQYKQDDYDTDESQDRKSNGDVNLAEMEDLNIG